jgi:MFS family permease
MRASANDNNQTTNETTETTDNEVSDIEVAKKEEPVSKGPAVFKPVYAYFVLFIALVCRIMVQWHRKGLTYAYGYTALGASAGSAFYEISSAYPELKNWYGLLAGLIYTIPYSLFGLVVGKLSDNANRKLWLGIAVIAASVTMGISGFVNSFFVLAIMRVFHGMFNSATNPLSFSLVSDYFPPDKRATANSIIQAGNYIGVGVSSLSILLISQFGWRTCYGVMAALGALFGLGTILFVKEPERGQFLSEDAKKKEAEKKAAAAKKAAEGPKENPLVAFVKNIGVVFSLPCARNTLIASSLRNFGGMCVSSFLPVFFGKVFPAFKAEYALLNAAALSICGMAASLGGGIIADKFEKKSYLTKAWLCIFGCALSPLLIAIGTLQSSNFYLGVACYALKVLVSGTYSGPAITMI